MFHISNHIIDLERTPVLRFILANLSEPLVIPRPVLYNCCWGIGARFQCWLAWFTRRYQLEESCKAAGAGNASALMVIIFQVFQPIRNWSGFHHSFCFNRGWLEHVEGTRWLEHSLPKSDQKRQFDALEEALPGANKGAKGDFQNYLVLSDARVLWTFSSGISELLPAKR